MVERKTPSEREEWYERTHYRILLFAGGIAFFGLVLGLVLDWYINPEGSTQKKDLIQAMALIIAGVVGAVGIYFTWRGQRLTQESLEDTRKNTQENLRITREGQITERFTRAIEQLGKVEDGQKLFEIRIGGIYALERIARESEKDYWPIMEVLTAYVRQNAPWASEDRQAGTEDAAVEKFEENTGSLSGKSEPVRVPVPDPDIEAIVTAVWRRARPAPDIQAIITVLQRRARSYHDGEPEPLDLHKTNLAGGHLPEANLHGANLSGANLHGANLHGANLYGASLFEAKLLEAILMRTDLTGASLWNANLHGANLWRANLQGADLSGANLTRANLTVASLWSANLSRAVLSEANLTGSSLSEANLTVAVLSRAVLTGAELANADLTGANLQGADLSGASLSEADLQGANLQGANLQGADLSGAVLSPALLEGTIGDDTTQLPSGLAPPEHWNRKTEDD